MVSVGEIKTALSYLWVCYPSPHQALQTPGVDYYCGETLLIHDNFTK